MRQTPARPVGVLGHLGGERRMAAAGMEIVGFAEIDAFGCHVLAQRCEATAPKYLPKGKRRSAYKSIKGGRVINFGDLTQITDDDLRALGIVDVLEGGTPCQGFSLAGCGVGWPIRAGR